MLIEIVSQYPNYSVFFVDLRDLEQRKDEFLHRNVSREYQCQYLENGLQLMPTTEVFKMIFGLSSRAITEADVEAKLRSGDDIIVLHEADVQF